MNHTLVFNKKTDYKTLYHAEKVHWFINHPFMLI